MQTKVILLIIFAIAGVSCDTLLQAQILFRHGARNQIYNNWNYIQYKDVMEYLTPVGMRQHYVLGQWLRSRYIENTDTSFNILKPQLDQNEIIVRSTDVNRTIVSALSNLYGLYPPGSGYTLPDNVPTDKFLPPNTGAIEPQIGLNSTPYLFQPVPIHIVPGEQDYVLRAYWEACPNQAQFYANNLQSELYQNITEASLPLFKQYGKEMQMNDEEIAKITLESLMEDQDTKVVYEQNGYPLPYDLSPDTQTKMADLYTFQFNMAYYLTWDEVTLLSTPFFQEILQNMDNLLNGTAAVKSYRFHMYSAHDTTVLLILNGLQLTSTECLYQVWNKSEVTNKNCIYSFPVFASNILFELWEDTTKNPYVKILYNGTYVPPCVNSQQLTCSLPQFKEQLTSQFKDYFSGCGIQTNVVYTENKVPTWIWVVISIIGVLFLLSSGFSVYVYNKLRKAKNTTILSEEA